MRQNGYDKCSNESSVIWFCRGAKRKTNIYFVCRRKWFRLKNRNSPTMIDGNVSLPNLVGEHFVYRFDWHKLLGLWSFLRFNCHVHSVDTINTINNNWFAKNKTTDSKINNRLNEIEKERNRIRKPKQTQAHVWSTDHGILCKRKQIKSNSCEEGAKKAQIFFFVLLFFFHFVNTKIIEDIMFVIILFQSFDTATT